MPYWMAGPHGRHVCYSLSDVERHKEQGWRLVYTGENPPTDAFDAASESVTLTVEVDIAQDAAQSAEADILAHPVVRILPQLPSMTKQQLEELRDRELQGKARKGLVAAINDAIG